jgi:hypothetical protein
VKDPQLVILEIKRPKLVEILKSITGVNPSSLEPSPKNEAKKSKDEKKPKHSDDGMDVLEILSKKSIREKKITEAGSEILKLLDAPTMKEKLARDQFITPGGTKVQQYCPHGTREDCKKANRASSACKMVNKFLNSVDAVKSAFDEFVIFLKIISRFTSVVLLRTTQMLHLEIVLI